MKTERVYEVVDITDDERYYTLGLFLTEDEAMSVLDAESPPYNDDDPEAVIVEVRSRPVGFHPHAFTPVASRTWLRNYDDTKPDWEAKPIQPHVPNKA